MNILSINSSTKPTAQAIVVVTDQTLICSFVSVIPLEGQGDRFCVSEKSYKQINEKDILCNDMYYFIGYIRCESFIYTIQIPSSSEKPLEDGITL